VWALIHSFWEVLILMEGTFWPPLFIVVTIGRTHCWDLVHSLEVCLHCWRAWCHVTTSPSLRGSHQFSGKHSFSPTWFFLVDGEVGGDGPVRGGYIYSDWHSFHGILFTHSVTFCWCDGTPPQISILLTMLTWHGLSFSLTDTCWCFHSHILMGGSHSHTFCSKWQAFHSDPLFLGGDWWWSDIRQVSLMRDTYHCDLWCHYILTFDYSDHYYLFVDSFKFLGDTIPLEEVQPLLMLSAFRY